MWLIVVIASSTRGFAIPQADTPSVIRPFAGPLQDQDEKRSVQLDLALEVDVLGDGGPTHKADILFYLSKEAFKRHIIDDLWQVKAATSAKSLGAVILSETIVDQIRKELRRQTGHNMDAAELCDLLKTSVLRSEAL